MNKRIFCCILLLCCIGMKGAIDMLVVSKDEKHGIIYFSPDPEISQALMGKKNDVWRS